MDWRREGEVLEHILMLLVSLAALADRAACAPLSLQLPALGFLTHGEAVARSFIGGLPSGTPALVAASQASDRAERLAADFRVLARILRALIARARRRALLATDETGPSMHPGEHGRPQGRPVPAPPAPDTS